MYQPQVVSVGGRRTPWIGKRSRVWSAMPSFVPGAGGSNAAPYSSQICRRSVSSESDMYTSVNPNRNSTTSPPPSPRTSASGRSARRGCRSPRREPNRVRSCTVQQFPERPPRGPLRSWCRSGSPPRGGRRRCRRGCSSGRPGRRSPACPRRSRSSRRRRRGSPYRGWRSRSWSRCRR